MNISDRQMLRREVKRFLQYGFSPHYDKTRLGFGSSPVWRRLKESGSELWLDTGSIPDAEELWTQEFSALTTNNTLLNKEIQKGTYDSVMREMADLLDEFPDMSDEERALELAFMLNAWHGLRLVERFESFVSVEEHTSIANDIAAAVEYGLRYYELCPERFFVKVPFTPAGLLAARRLSKEGVPVNHTLGFSARQNYIMGRIANPAFVNVFLGRLGTFVVQNGLGSGCYVGEKATLASQAVIKQLRRQYGVQTRQIAASMREGGQVADLAGVDVMTIPPKAAADFLYSCEDLEAIIDQTENEYIPGVDEDVDFERVRLNTLWDVDEKLIRCVDLLENENLDAFGADDLVDFFAEHGCGDAMVRWSAEDRAVSSVEGKIPKLANWHEKLICRAIGLDSLMSLAGLGSFDTDQKAIDQRVKEVLTPSYGV